MVGLRPRPKNYVYRGSIYFDSSFRAMASRFDFEAKKLVEEYICEEFGATASRFDFES